MGLGQTKETKREEICPYGNFMVKILVEVQTPNSMIRAYCLLLKDIFLEEKIMHLISEHMMKFLFKSLNKMREQWGWDVTTGSKENPTATFL